MSDAYPHRPTAPQYWHGKEVAVLYAVVARVNERIHTFYVASTYHSGVDAETTITEQKEIVEKWRDILGVKDVVITAFRWVPV